MQAVSRWLWQAYMLKSDDGAYITLMLHTFGPESPIYRSPCLTIHVEQRYSTLKTANKTRLLV